MTSGSLQLRQYMAARRAGTPREEAAAAVAMPLREASDWDADEAKGLLGWIGPAPTNEIPHLGHAAPTGGGGAQTSERSAARAASTDAGSGGGVTSSDARERLQLNQGDETMARAKKAPQVEEQHAPDFDLAVKIYREDIKPAISKVGEFSQEMSTAYKAIKKQANIQPQAARTVFRIADMEEAKRDDYLRSFNGLLKKLGIFMPTDLVDAAEGKGETGAGVVPTAERRRPKLATVPTTPPPADDSDLAGHQEAAE